MRAFCTAPRPAPVRVAAPAIRGNVVMQAKHHPLDPSIDVNAFMKHEGDVGSTEVQIARLSARVRHLTTHLQANRKDYACARGLMGILGQRTNLLKYLYSKDKQAFARVVRELKIRNPIKSVSLKKA